MTSNLMHLVLLPDLTKTVCGIDIHIASDLGLDTKITLDPRIITCETCQYLTLQTQLNAGASHILDEGLTAN